MKKEANTKLSLSFSNSNAKIDEPLISLLEGVDKFGSISAAAEFAELSYSYAHARIRAVERTSKTKLVMQSGEHTIDGSTLTPSGKRLVSDYRNLTSSINEASRSLVREYLEVK